MSNKPKVLFVCLGNICRSPMAHGAFRTAAAEAGLEVEIDSAGTGDYHIGKEPDGRAIAAAARNGSAIEDLRARQVTAQDFLDFTHIFAFDAQNLADLEAIRPADATARLALLMDMVPGREGHAVADPYHGDSSDFDLAWADVNAAAKTLVAVLISEQG
ncbi:Protein-tyrosine-phosphatase [Alteripontixanthobacter maritimus]|uniref:protein-tyrosine-phosphatase n=1 Tax=Alteripontixanthobacter maritimus TaxID=2161824 RepID=A0A369Q938_9SPHN|nr:low molecular weight protein-tyrosine-phosphatase [Alteripontixanthobacter maritimus]RDC59676.1 Protein-tyrosine-phosphatase [Alteripontixanthobacter maritimus]